MLIRKNFSNLLKFKQNVKNSVHTTQGESTFSNLQSHQSVKMMVLLFFFFRELFNTRFQAIPSVLFLFQIFPSFERGK